MATPFIPFHAIHGSSTFPVAYPVWVGQSLREYREEMGILTFDSVFTRILWVPCECSMCVTFDWSFPSSPCYLDQVCPLWFFVAFVSCVFFYHSVPGPARSRIQMEGIEVISWTALPPQGGKGSCTFIWHTRSRYWHTHFISPGTLGMGIISYAGGLCISVAADKVPQSEGVARRVCERFEARFALYVECAKQVLDHQDWANCIPIFSTVCYWTIPFPQSFYSIPSITEIIPYPSSISIIISIGLQNVRQRPPSGLTSSKRCSVTPRMLMRFSVRHIMFNHYIWLSNRILPFICGQSLLHSHATWHLSRQIASTHAPIRR